MKICNVCKKSKPLSEYHKDRRLISGLKNKCGTCSALALKKYREKRPEIFRDAQRKWKKKNPDKPKKWDRENSKYRTDYQREYSKRPEVKKKNKARKLGRTIPLKSHCEKCSSRDNLERHHPDYDKPLEVVTLCKSCHIGVHYNREEIAQQALKPIGETSD